MPTVPSSRQRLPGEGMLTSMKGGVEVREEGARQGKAGMGCQGQRPLLPRAGLTGLARRVGK